MIDPTEAEPALAEPKKTVRRKSSTPRAGGRTRRKTASESELPLQEATAEATPEPALDAPAAAPEPVEAVTKIEAAPQPEPVAAEQAPIVPPQAAAPAPATSPRFPENNLPQDRDQIEDAAQILSRITSAPLSAAETQRENNARNQPQRPPQQQQGYRNDRFERRDRQDRNDRFERPERQERQEYDDAPAGESAGETDAKQEPVYAEGIVEVSGKGFGFLR